VASPLCAGQAIARALIRSDADRVEVEKYSPMATTIHGCIQYATSNAPDKTAIVYVETTDPEATPRAISYDELLRGIERSACLFAEAAEGQTPVVSRPVVVIVIHSTPDQISQLDEQLRATFMGFEVRTEMLDLEARA